MHSIVDESKNMDEIDSVLFPDVIGNVSTKHRCCPRRKRSQLSWNVNNRRNVWHQNSVNDIVFIVTCLVTKGTRY